MWAFFRPGLNLKGGPNWYLVPGRVVWEGCGIRKGGVRSWCCEGCSEHSLRSSSAKLVSAHAVSVANRSCKATGVTAPEDMALIKRMPKWLFTCLLLGVWPSCCTQHHGVDGYSAQGWSYMLLHSSTVLNLSTFTALYQQHCGTSEQL